VHGHTQSQLQFSKYVPSSFHAIATTSVHSGHTRGKHTLIARRGTTGEGSDGTPLAESGRAERDWATL